MITFFVFVIGIIIFWLVKDHISKGQELNNDPTFAAGIKNKYPIVFDSFEKSTFRITKIERDEVKMIGNFYDGTLKMEITVMYNVGNKIHFIAMAQLNGNTKAKSFFYSSNASDEVLSKTAIHDIDNFMKSLEGVKNDGEKKIDINSILALLDKKLKDLADKINSGFEGWGLEEKIDKCEQLVVEAKSIISYLKSEKQSSSESQKLYDNLYFVIVGLFVKEALELNFQAQNNNSEQKLKQINNIVNKIKSLISGIMHFNPNVENLENSKTFKDFEAMLAVTQVLIQKKFEKIEEEFNQDLKKEVHCEVNERSKSLFNLGYYILNSRNIMMIPNEDITEGVFDFKLKYFPDFNPIKYEDYFTAIKIFEMSISADPKNVMARIFREVAYFYADISHEDSDIDGAKAIEKLKEIVVEFPRHSIAHIELADAYSCFNYTELAIKHAEIALNIFGKSSYLYYRASMIYNNYGSEEAIKKSMLASGREYGENNPRFDYLRALNEKDCAVAVLYIDSALEKGQMKEHFWSRNQIYAEFRYKVAAHNYNNAKLEITLQNDALVLKKLEARESYYSKYTGFTKFHSLEISANFDFFSICHLLDSSPQVFPLPKGKLSIQFFDYNCSFRMLEKASLLSSPFKSNAGSYKISKQGTLLLRDLNCQQLF